MRLEFVYLALSLVVGIIYYAIQKKNVFGEHEHSYVLEKGMLINMVLCIIFMVLCLINLLTVNGVVHGMEIRYTLDAFKFLLGKPSVSRRAIIWMNVALYVFEIFTMIVAVKIAVRRRGHKNLKLEKILVSNCVVCAVCTFLATVEVGFCVFAYM